MTVPTSFAGTSFHDEGSEAGAGAPLYLDPLDGPAWRRAIEDYTGDEPGDRQAQLARIAAWKRPEWEQHIASLHDLIEKVA